MASSIEQTKGAKKLEFGEEVSRSFIIAVAQTTKERYGVKKPIASEIAVTKAAAKKK